MTPKQVESNQRARLLERLKTCDWVPAFELAGIALQYNARVKELREAGHYIENRTERVDGMVHSWFRLVPHRRPVTAAAPTITVERADGDAAESLFGELAPEPGYPD